MCGTAQHGWRRRTWPASPARCGRSGASTRRRRRCAWRASRASATRRWCGGLRWRHSSCRCSCSARGLRASSLRFRWWGRARRSDRPVAERKCGGPEGFPE
ncbi:unnamed protein product, partial [Phaeothamnion confervicola]